MKLLVPYDGSTDADAVIEDMRRAGLPEEAEVLVLCLTEGASRQDHIVAELSAQPASVSTEATSVETVGAHVQKCFPRWKLYLESLRGAGSDIVLKTSGWWKPDLLIMGRSERSRAARLVAGNVPLEVVHQARCSVRVAGGSPRPGEAPIQLVIGNDGSPEAEAAVREVSRRRWPRGSEARVISVVETPALADSHSRLHHVIEDSMNRLRRHPDLSVSGTVVEGDPRQELLREANGQNADTIFVGASGLRGIGLFLIGSVSTAVLTRARCTVEVVRV